ncbi:MAG: flagellar basal body P-ring formation protein FlgA [Deltaproteobacteria bacterium]|nr:flagellar basal body P-ring formation protein FlgA [Deltaproteobacteria bacterium]
MTCQIGEKTIRRLGPNLVIILITGWLSTAHALDIHVKDQVTVNDDRVYLADIASFHPHKDHRVARLAGIEVASAPAPGKVLRFNRQFLNYKIGSALGDEEGIRVELPSTTEIRREAQFIPREQLEDIFKDHVLNHSPYSRDRMTFERIKAPGDVALPQGQLHWEVLERGSGLLGHVPLVISFRVDGKSIRKVPVSGKVSVTQRFLKAAKRIKSGMDIERGDIVLAMEERMSLRDQAMTDPEDVVGKRAVRTIQPGQIITAKLVDEPPMVKKGKTVIIKAENRWLRVTALGKVLENGSMGDQVRVLNISSGKEVFSTVRGPGLVEVTF